MPNISSIDPSMSSANTSVYAVYIARNTNDTDIVTQTLEANLPLASCACSPNPAVENTQLKLHLKAAGTVQIAAYTRKGELVQLINNKILAAGHHQIDWNTSELTPGVYYVRARMNGVSKVLSILVNP
jgi:hypothetical protein